MRSEIEYFQEGPEEEFEIEYGFISEVHNGEYDTSLGLDINVVDGSTFLQLDSDRSNLLLEDMDVDSPEELEGNCVGVYTDNGELRGIACP